MLTKAQAQKIAQMAHDGLARAINPIHTMFDGDTIFALGTGKSGNPTLIGVMAAEVMAIAVVRAARAARGIEGYPSAADL